MQIQIKNLSIGGLTLNIIGSILLVFSVRPYPHNWFTAVDSETKYFMAYIDPLVLNIGLCLIIVGFTLQLIDKFIEKR